MSVAESSSAPRLYRRRSFFGRMRLRIGRWPWIVRIGLPLFVLLVSTGTAVGYYAENKYAVKLVDKLLRRDRSKEINERWQNFDAAVRTGDEKKMIEALDEIIKANPNDKIAIARKKALETGEADPSDDKMARLTCVQHFRANRWKEAEREARKMLEHNPNDWLARCICAAAALNRQDLKAARAEVDLLPDLNKVESNVSATVLNFGFELYAKTQKDPANLRLFVSNRVVDFVRSSRVLTMPMAEKLTLLECYLNGYDPSSNRTQLDGLNKAVTSVSEIFDSCLAEAIEKKDLPALNKLNYIGNFLTIAYRLLLRDGTISEDQAKELIKNNAEGLERVWKTALDIDPKYAPAYLGLAKSQLAQKNTASAAEIISEARVYCGDHQEILEFHAYLLRKDNNGGEAVRSMLAAARKDPTNATRWFQVIDSAAAVADMGAIRNACEEIRKITPNDPRLPRIEAALALGNHQPDQALQIYAKMDQDQLLQDPILANGYVRAMIASNTTAGLPKYLEMAEAMALEKNSPLTIAAALRGVSETNRFDAAAGQKVIGIAKRMLERWPDNADLMTAQMLAYYQAAENSEPRWELAATKAAILALEGLLVKRPENADLVAGIVWMRIKGEKDYTTALRNAGPLADLFKREQSMSPLQLLALGTAYLMNNRNKDALVVLEKACKQAATPGLIIALATAYHKNEKYREAAATILSVQPVLSGLSRQERADYNEAVLLIKP